MKPDYTDDGGSAFPGEIDSGLTAREFFAAYAMQGMLSNSINARSGDEIVVTAYRFADAMLAARYKK